MLFPIRRQLAAHRLLPERAQLSVLIRIALDHPLPFVFMFLTAIYAPAKMSQRFVGHIELFVFGPAQMSLGFAHGFFAGWIAVGLARAGGWHAVTDDRFD